MISSHVVGTKKSPLGRVILQRLKVAGLTEQQWEMWLFLSSLIMIPDSAFMGQLYPASPAIRVNLEVELK